MSEDQARRFADRTARVAREAVEKGSAVAAESARDAEQSYFATADGIRDFNVRLIEMAHANTLAALDSVREISTAKGPSEAASVDLARSTAVRDADRAGQGTDRACSKDRDLKRRADDAQLRKCIQGDHLSGRGNGADRRLSRLSSRVLYFRLSARLRFKPLQKLAEAFLPIGLRLDQDRQQGMLFRRIDPHAL
jgi:hypothetical protein